MVVQHNLTAMNSNRMLGVTTSSQAKSTEKLSSGYKINRAADDAAGLSISEKMRKQIRGLTQASLNAEDGISAVQTAEGALNEVQDMLQRMNELAVKAANGTMSENDRSYIQDEIKALETEIDRVAETTKFNETYLLKGDKNVDKVTDYQYTEKTAPALKDGIDLYTKDENGNYSAQPLTAEQLKTALEAGETVYSSKEVEAEEAEAADVQTNAAVTLASKIPEQTGATNIGTATWADAGDGKKALTLTGMDAGKIAIAGVEVNFDTDIDTTGAAVAAKKQEIIEASGGTITDVTYDNVNDKIIVTGADVPETYEAKVKLYNQDGSVAFEAGDAMTADEKDDIASYYTTPASEEKVAVAGKDYVEATKNALYDKDGNEISANGLQFYHDEEGNYLGGLYTDKEATTEVDDITEYVDNTQEKTGALTLKLHVGADATDNNQISVDLDAMSAAGIGVKDLKVDGADDTNARNAIETIKAALQQVSQQRSALGAVQNRLEHTIANLDNVVENTTAAESQIRDTDMATEMVKYSNNNILAQAGQAMLAQANQSNQGVLSLLG